MPKFILDRGTRESAKRFEQLDEFTQGYIEAMFFTECHSDNPELENATFADLTSESLTDAIEDCARFQKENDTLLSQYYELTERPPSNDGHDFWLTRNGHGTGFWDRGAGIIGDQLTSIAHTWKEKCVLSDDNGNMYVY